jgi:hypothetical protein
VEDAKAREGDAELQDLPVAAFVWADAAEATAVSQFPDCAFNGAFGF